MYHTHIRVFLVESRNNNDIKAIRAELSITQKELANAMDVSLETIKSWEQGKRTPTGLANKVLSLLSKEPALLKKFTSVR